MVSRRLRRYFFVKSYYRWRHVLLLWYSKASRYTALSCTDLADARFWIGSKIIWDKRIYLVKARFSDHLAFTLLSNKSCTNFELHEFFFPPKTCISRPYCSGYRWTFWESSGLAHPNSSSFQWPCLCLGDDHLICSMCVRCMVSSLL